MTDSKPCTVCKEVKPLTEFAVKRKVKRASWCKSCQNTYSAAHYSRNRQSAIDRASKNKALAIAKYRQLKEDTPCADCGLKFPYYVTHYDHLEGHVKINNVSTLMSMGMFRQVEQEMKKCELVCANCHSVRTHNRLQAKLTYPNG